MVPEAALHIGLVNSTRQVVVSGAPRLLELLRKTMGDRRVAPGDNQPRTPFSERLMDFRSVFLPMTVPFHSPLLADTVPMILQDCAKLGLGLGADATLKLPLFSTYDGSTVTAAGGALLEELIALIATRSMNWAAVTDRFAAASGSGGGNSTILDFGPGGPSPAASLSARNTVGTGVNVYMSTLASLGYRQIATKPAMRTLDELFSAPVTVNPNWRAYEPKIVTRNADGQAFVSTKFTEILGKRPIVIAGMTPTTSINGVPLVAACANAGYHVELAGGGLSRAAIFKSRLNKLVTMLNPGCGICTMASDLILAPHHVSARFRDRRCTFDFCCVQYGASGLNLLYLNSKQWNFQFPLACEMRLKGYPIEAITIGAGVPSLDVAGDLIEKMAACGMRYLAFKPGSKDAIVSVIGIATANPHFPIMVQWTGGRGGGHHSFEDAHEPMLSTYGALRRLPNVILVAGSGFGNGADSFPYLSGEWSLSRGFPRMPFDAILFASRMMVAREAATSPAIKDLICATPGVPLRDEKSWEKSYKDHAGGVITVKSELGEPIHKIATRGMKLWREFDQRFFALPRGKERDAAIHKSKHYIIARINADFQKLYFGKKVDGRVCDVQEMTYAEVLQRMVELMYVTPETEAAYEKTGLDAGLTLDGIRNESWTEHGRWLDVTFMTRVRKFILRAQERFCPSSPRCTVDNIKHSPMVYLNNFLDVTRKGDLRKNVLVEEDLDFFFDLCLTGGKPVNFVPIIDGDLGVWFKKDSLWYSEDLAAVPGLDADRVCVLQGPVSVYYNRVANEPAAKILEQIHSEFASATKALSPSTAAVDYVGFASFGAVPAVANDTVNVVVSSSTGAADGEAEVVRTVAHIPAGAMDEALPSTASWLELLSGPKEMKSWLRCVLGSNHIGVGAMWMDNPIRRILKPSAAQRAEVVLTRGPNKDFTREHLRIYSSHPELVHPGEQSPAVEICLADVQMTGSTLSGATVLVKLLDLLPVKNNLVFSFKYDPSDSTTPLTEVAGGRIAATKHFYKGVWLDGVDGELSFAGAQKFETKIEQADVERFNASINYPSQLESPLDMTIMAAWQPLIACLFHPNVTGSFLDLVHLDNGFEVVSCTDPTGVRYKIDDVVVSEMDIVSITNNKSGQTVVVSGPVAEKLGRFKVILTSSFLFRGEFDSNSYETKTGVFSLSVEDAAHIAVLGSKSWIMLDEAAAFSIGQSLKFTVKTEIAVVQGQQSFSTTGTLCGCDANDVEHRKIGKIVSTVVGAADPVTSYLDRMRKGQTTYFKSGGYLTLKKPEPVVSPIENRTYSVASRDFNPIHRNPFIATLADLPDTIVHGMWSSAATRGVLLGTGQIDRVRSFSASYVGMVKPGDVLCTDVKHVGMQQGDKIMELTTRSDAGTKVVQASARVETAPTAYVFTGQGSAEVNMGMKLFGSSAAAKAVWEKADKHLLATYGFSILNIVRKNPKQMTIHFGGRKGSRIRKNFIGLQTASPDGKTMEQLLPDIKPGSVSYTFKSPTGLLFSTQFTQCALVLQEKAVFEDLRLNDLIPQNVTFAGHSLGEYACLASTGDILSIEGLVELVFLRGLVMQKAVPRDKGGRSDYGMVAANPTRVGVFFTEDLLHEIVDAIGAKSDKLIQVVNYNVKDLQYVVAGHVVALEILSVVLTAAQMKPESLKAPAKIIEDAVATIAAKERKCQETGVPFTMARGTATIPLPGIDVPFHSRYLMGGVPAFRAVLQEKIDVGRMKKAVAQLTGNYLPNVMARPFAATKEYVEDTFKQTKSPFLEKLLAEWDTKSDDVGYVAYTLVIELLAYQFASPVRWIETVEQMLARGVRRFIEIGPAPTLTNMMLATLRGNEATLGPLTDYSVLFCERDDDNDAIYFRHEDAGPDSATILEEWSAAKAAATKVAIPAKSPAVTSAAAAPSAAPTTAAPPPPAPAAVMAAPVSMAPLEDVPVSAQLVLRIMVALKMNKTLAEVTATSTVHALAGGKSALQNEVLGDLEKEFGNSPDNAAEMSIDELAKTIGAGYQPLGPASQGLINKLISTKMPGGFGMGGVKTHLTSERTLGPQRIDAVLLVGLTSPPAARLDGEDAAKAWLDGAADKYGEVISESIPRASQMAASAGPAMPFAAAPAMTQASAAPVAEAPVSALEVLRMMLSTKLKVAYGHAGASVAIKDLTGGKSAVQNEIIGDLEKEFGGVPDSAGEMSLQELATELGAGYAPLGPVSKGMVDKLVGQKMSGGFGMAAVRGHLSAQWMLGPQRQDGVLVFSLTMQPGARLSNEPASKAFLDEAVQAYAKEMGVQLGGGGGGGGGSAVSASHSIGSADLKPLLEKLKEFVQSQLDAGHQYLGLDEMAAARALETEVDLRKSVETQLGLVEAEMGEYFVGGIVGKFSAAKTRVYDSHWNWASQELVGLVLSLMRRENWLDDEATTECRAHILNCASPELLGILGYFSEAAGSRGLWRVGKWCQNLQADLEKAMNDPPKCMPVVKSTVPTVVLEESGAITYSEPPRYADDSSAKFVDGLRTGADGVPFTYIRSGSGSVDTEATGGYLGCLANLLDSGVSFEGKNVLVTGCGPGSIAVQLVSFFLEAGAKVIATTSNFSAKRCRFYQQLYQNHCAKSSSLTVLPFNGGSLADVTDVISHIYSDGKGGLNVDIDFFIPFAAISETGRPIDNIDSKSELAHRIMTTNVIRMLGEIKKEKASRGVTTRPVVAILPLSPNHGLFGYDGLYAESKLGLEALINKRNSEDWADYINIIGAVIGWTRGTGLMAGNNMTAPGVEARGCRTFSTREMAICLLALAHPAIVDMSNETSIIADLGGGFATVPNLNEAVSAIRKDLLADAAVKKAVNLEAAREQIDTENKKPEAKPQGKRARFDCEGTAFPTMPTAEDLKDIAPELQGMIDLKQTVVIVGFGEVGPWGGSRTRWEMEAYGEFSIEGCIELAWMTGRIKYFNGKLPSGKKHIGWVDARSSEPVAEEAIKELYEEDMLKHSGIRIIEPEIFEGYNPNKKRFLHQVAIDRPTQWFDVADAAEADTFRAELGVDSVDVRVVDGIWQMKLKRGAVLSIPRAMQFDRLVAGQIPSGWDPARYGIPADIVTQVDPITLYTLVSTAEALIAAGVPDPYEFYKYIHVSELGNTMGGGMGGMRSLKRIFGDRQQEGDVQGDILQESFINTMPAWVNMLLLSSSGPIKTPVGACATAAESVDIAVDTIKSGKARVVVCGGYDDFGEEGSYEFANMKATSSTTAERAMGREPEEMCRPTTTTRGGFMESQGAGIQILMEAGLALEMGCPVYGIVALTSTATDKEGRSVPAPGQGILTTCREKALQFPDPFLDLAYRKRNLGFDLDQVQQWAAREQAELKLECQKMEELHSPVASQFRAEREALMHKEVERLSSQARRRWANDFFVGRSEISPIRGALSVWGLGIDDLAVASFHGTGTKLNDKNESQVTHRQMEHLGRTRGNPVMVVCQKWLTGHPKGAAASWMLHGLVQCMNTGVVPGNRNADNIGPELQQYDHLLYPNKSIRTPKVKAAMLKSFGFGQAGAEVVLVHPHYLFAAIAPAELEKYTALRATRECKGRRFFFEALAGKRTLFKAKSAPPYTAETERFVYTNPTVRAEYDHDKGSWFFDDGLAASDNAGTGADTVDVDGEEEPVKFDRQEAEVLLSALRRGDHFGEMISPAEQLEARVIATTQKVETAHRLQSAEEREERSAPSPLNTKKMLEVTMRQTANNMRQAGDKGIGIDVEPVATFKNASQTFIERNFTSEEQSYCKSHAHPAAGFAGRWAAKEAVIKAISSTAQNARSLWRGGGAPLKDIAILPSTSGAPVVELHGHAKEVAAALGVTQVQVSISHAADHAVAQAIAR